MSLTTALDIVGAHDPDDRVTGWVEDGLHAASRAAQKRQDELFELDRQAEAAGADVSDEVAVETVLLDQAQQAISGLLPLAPQIATLGRARAASVLIRMSAGDREGARRLLLATRSTFAERRIASGQSTEQVLAASEARAKATEELLDALGKIGLAALKALIPLLLAAL